MLFILAEKHPQEEDYVKALRGRVSHPNRYIDEVDDSKTLPQYPKIQLSYLQGRAYELEDAKQYDAKWKSWAYKYLPVFVKKFKHVMSPKFSGGRPHVQAINKAVTNNSAKLWLASDPDVEGEGLIYEYTDLNGLDNYIAGRVWIRHGLTVPGLIKTFHHDVLDPAKTRPRAIASHAREAADWYIGVNISRLATDIARKYGYTKGAFTAGRVQTPTLALITARRNQRKNFKPSTSYRLAFLDKNGLNFTGNVSDNGKSNKAMFKIKDKAIQAANRLSSAPKVTLVSNQKRHQSAPKLPKTNDMQGYIIKHAHISAQAAADKVLEPMYDEYKAQTYPRTECNLITTDDFNELKKKLPQYVHLYEQIIGKKLPPGLFTNLKPRRKYVDFTGKKVQKQGHGAITPNPENKVMSYAQYQKLNFAEKVDYKYVLGCTLAMFADDHAYQELKVSAKAGKYSFKASNKSPLQNATDWHQIFPQKNDKHSIQAPVYEYQSGTTLQPNNKYTDTKGYYPKPETTKAPSPITESNLVRTVMPKYKLGTSSTRASIIARLKHTKLIRSASKKSASENLKRNEFMPTKKGIICLELLRYSHLFNLAKVSSWQDQMDAIADEKLSYDDFIRGIKADILDDIKKMPRHQYHFTFKAQPKTKNFNSKDTGISCPTCKKGTIRFLSMDYPIHDTYVKLLFYGCSNRRCKFFCPYKTSNIVITPSVLKEIINNKFKVQKIHNPKSGKTFRASLKIVRGKLTYKFPRHKPIKTYTDIECPKCHGHRIDMFKFKNKKTGKPFIVFNCHRRSCNFSVFQNFHGMKLDHDTLKELCEHGLKNQKFISYITGKPYTADAVYSRGKFKLKFND